MSSNALPINITILDKEYRIACPSGEQSSLLASAEYLDNRMREIRENGKVIGSEKIAVLAALNIAHELLNSGRLNGDLNKTLTPRLKNLQNKVNEALQRARQMEI
jgi:cell division protein ZapA